MIENGFRRSQWNGVVKNQPERVLKGGPQNYSETISLQLYTDCKVRWFKSKKNGKNNPVNWMTLKS